MGLHEARTCWRTSLRPRCAAGSPSWSSPLGAWAVGRTFGLDRVHPLDRVRGLHAVRRADGADRDRRRARSCAAGSWRSSRSRPPSRWRSRSSPAGSARRGGVAQRRADDRHDEQPLRRPRAMPSRSSTSSAGTASTCCSCRSSRPRRSTAAGPGGAARAAAAPVGRGASRRRRQRHPQPPPGAARAGRGSDRTSLPWTSTMPACPRAGARPRRPPVPAARAAGRRTTGAGTCATFPRRPAAPAVIAGDFNATLDHQALRAVLDRGWQDAAAEAGEGLQRHVAGRAPRARPGDRPRARQPRAQRPAA